LYFDFGKIISDFLSGMNDCTFPLGTGQPEHETLLSGLPEVFGIERSCDTFFIPAGRSTITLFSDQLNYIFTTFDEQQRRTIDYCTQKFVQLILKIKSWFAEYRGNISPGSPRRVLMELSERILRARYRYIDNSERLYWSDGGYIKINLASSGQQEAVWIANLLQYFLAEKKDVFLIVEEPEAHLYPESQMIMADMLSLFNNIGKNACIVTTHSPYILGELNNLILCGQVPPESKAQAERITDKRAWINRETIQAFFVSGGIIRNANSESGLIRNELIDGASSEINEHCDDLLELLAETEI
jgi:hypothetical protein